MTVLSHVDPTAEVACTLPVREAGERLTAFGDLVGDRLEDLARSGDRLRIRMRRDGDPELEAKARAWAIEEKGCCAFLGFEIESDPDTVTLNSAGNYVRMPFAGNRVPRNRMDPIALNMLKYWPAPNA